MRLLKIEQHYFVSDPGASEIKYTRAPMGAKFLEMHVNGAPSNFQNGDTAYISAFFDSERQMQRILQGSLPFSIQNVYFECVGDEKFTMSVVLDDFIYAVPTNYSLLWWAYE